MKTLFLLAALSGVMAAVPAAAQSCTGTPGGNAVKLTVQATGLHSGDGEVAFTVYPDDKGRFLAKGGKLLRARVPTRAPATTACFWLPPGYYAIAQYHDENGDHSFNRTLWAPKEGFGFSNDAPTSIGLPSFASARFAVPAGGATIRMAMRYRR
ncbi:DUF2141 domain-containing protein [Sphingomonas sp. BT553]|uniref:DUF2141 domain-containing protein n=2 Tax=Sphingomonas mollis TaxID=2795726 RepID=A0ABS0XK62_9SPHN|nr:DUF2141 domain-containing protein [Sphingomonas sp. BT553]